MRIDCALLCDAATVREGLLHVLGGGIAHAVRPSFPAPAAMSLAVHVWVTQDEATGDHVLAVRSKTPKIGQ